MPKIDLKRLSNADRIILGGGSTLLVSMFFQWFSVSFAVGDLPLGSESASAWSGLPWLRWVLAATALAAICLPLLKAAGRSVRHAIAPSTLIAMAGAVSYLAILWRLVDPPGDFSERGLAAFIGFLASGAITYGAYRAMEEEGASFKQAADRLARPKKTSGSRPRKPSAPPPPPRHKRDKEDGAGDRQENTGGGRPGDSSRDGSREGPAKDQ